MKKILILILSLLIYIGSVQYNTKWFIEAYSDNGRWSLLEPDMGAVFFTYMPVANTVACIMNIIGDTDLPGRVFNK